MKYLPVLQHENRRVYSVVVVPTGKQQKAVAIIIARATDDGKG